MIYVQDDHVVQLTFHTMEIDDSVNCEKDSFSASMRFCHCTGKIYTHY